ncbi:hypothetical protein V2J09_015514 [Rumex salicifolius]
MEFSPMYPMGFSRNQFHKKKWEAYQSSKGRKYTKVNNREITLFLMGSDDVLLQPNGFHLSGLLPNREASVTRKLDLDRWTIAEEQTAELIAHIQPDNRSWDHRNAIALFVQRLICQSISCVVFSYGSVPLKTYLPDGDIDLTLFSKDQSFNGNWATVVRDILEKEENNEDAEYCVREVQLIHAEVKLVKCLVNNIVVDISFGQLSGLCTLCFLEKVDLHIGQNHLFKRSIILIKAWCYYESRLLGAYHGLISTYALETLILYIFRVFNNSFAGPLEVLYRFLEFFSNFDWDNFCISLLGPVPIGSLPDMTVAPPRLDGDALLLSEKFLHDCSMEFSVHPSTHVKEQFATKHLNIIDFLRTSNNLGRSVSKGNFFRIRSAFSFGAQRLARLLDCSKECLVAELNRFFVNTWDGHGKIHRPDARISPASDLRQEEPENIAQKRIIKQTNSVAFEKGDKRLNANHMSLNGGEKVCRSEVFQDKIQYGRQFGRTCSSPELMNARSKFVHENISNNERGRQQTSISESDRSGKTRRSRVANNCNIKVNAVDSSTRENSPSESYDGDYDSASTSSRCGGDHVVGEDISSGVKPVQKSANVMHSPWIQTFGRQFVGFPLPEAGWDLNFYYPHVLPTPSAPIIGRFNDDVKAESSTQQVDHALWEQNTENENGFHSDISLEDRLGAVTTMDPNPVDGNNICQSNHVNGGENGVPFSDSQTAFPSFPHAEALQFPTSSINYPTPNWVCHMPLLPSWPMSANNYPLFPVAFLPTGSTDPYAFMPQYSTYKCQSNAEEDNISLDAADNSIHQSRNSSMPKIINEIDPVVQCSSDILSSDIDSHVINMMIGRSCQSVNLQGPFSYPPMVPPQFLQGTFLLGDPGRPPVPTANDTVLPETPLMHASHHHPNHRNFKTGYQYYPKGVPAYGTGTGTGTYFPSPKNGRDFQTLNSRYNRGNYRNQRKEQHREQAVNANFNSRPRFGGRSRKWEKPNSSFESFDRSGGRNNGAPLQWEAYGNYSHPTYHQPMVHDPTYVVYPNEPNSGYCSQEHPPDYSNSSPDQPSSPRLKGVFVNV